MVTVVLSWIVAGCVALAVVLAIAAWVTDKAQEETAERDPFEEPYGDR